MEDVATTESDGDVPVSAPQNNLDENGEHLDADDDLVSEGSGKGNSDDGC